MQFKLDDVMSLTAARWAAAEGFDWVSFNFDKDSSAYLPPMKANEIMNWVKGPEFIGRGFKSEIQSLIDIYNLLHLAAIETEYEQAETLIFNHEIPVFIHADSKNFDRIMALSVQQPLVRGVIVNSVDIQKLTEKCKLCFFNADLPVSGAPLGVNFLAPPELETGFTDFKSLENSVDLWKNFKKV
jgi:hypothetical protein